MTTPASPLDPDVAMYRAEKARRRDDTARLLLQARRALETQLREAKAKPGRPRNPSAHKDTVILDTFPSHATRRCTTCGRYHPTSEYAEGSQCQSCRKPRRQYPSVFGKRRCYSCKSYRDPHDFYRKKGGRDGLADECKPCNHARRARCQRERIAKRAVAS